MPLTRGSLPPGGGGLGWGGRLERQPKTVLQLASVRTRIRLSRQRSRLHLRSSPPRCPPPPPPRAAGGVGAGGGPAPGRAPRGGAGGGGGGGGGGGERVEKGSV